MLMSEQQLTLALAWVQVEAVRLSQAEAGKQADSDRGAKEALWQKLQEANQRLAAASQARPCIPCPMKMRYLLSWHLHATAWASGANSARCHISNCTVVLFRGKALREVARQAMSTALLAGCP